VVPRVPRAIVAKEAAFPENAAYERAARGWRKPLRMSVTPHAENVRVDVGCRIIASPRPSPATGPRLRRRPPRSVVHPPDNLDTRPFR
jgi:hypothetical protein